MDFKKQKALLGTKLLINKKKLSTKPPINSKIGGGFCLFWFGLGAGVVGDGFGVFFFAVE